MTHRLIHFRYDESIKNSFCDQDTYLLFLKRLYQILMTHQFPFKAKKMLVQGPSNSGKSVWIVPLFEILASENIASITREGKFGAALMTKDTEAVFVDEVSPKTIDLDEFKGILQGWLACRPTKTCQSKSHSIFVCHLHDLQQGNYGLKILKTNLISLQLS